MRRFSPFVALALAACSADHVAPDRPNDAAADDTSPAVRVVDGTLHFATSEAYFDFGREMVNRDPGERRRWEASHGFTSMLSYAEDVMGDYELRLGEALGRRKDAHSACGHYNRAKGKKLEEVSRVLAATPLRHQF